MGVLTFPSHFSHSSERCKSFEKNKCVVERDLFDVKQEFAILSARLFKLRMYLWHVCKLYIAFRLLEKKFRFSDFSNFPRWVKDKPSLR